ncbi:hypothetical protein TWF106_006343 [Orbilia oligospora]|uniref:Uncharacterized protein n=1 Tax=Orbilia oligospora TaxID=2813651 RepID=A0A7C8V2X4_ORBOL|nr:hypothetical protein TWF106_006343 [Orbilia oligospora]
MSFCKGNGPRAAPKEPVNEIPFWVTVLYNDWPHHNNDSKPGDFIALPLSYQAYPSTRLAAITERYERIIANYRKVGKMIYFVGPAYSEKDLRLSFKGNGLLPDTPGGMVVIGTYQVIPRDVQNQGLTSKKK